MSNLEEKLDTPLEKRTCADCLSAYPNMWGHLWCMELRTEVDDRPTVCEKYEE